LQRGKVCFIQHGVKRGTAAAAGSHRTTVEYARPRRSRCAALPFRFPCIPSKP
jgi:hypothetical protein